MKRRIARFAARLFCVVASLLLLEGLCSALAYWRYGTLNVADLNALDRGNAFVTNASGLMPHPYLAYVHNSHGQRNNVGTTGADFPLSRDPTYFTILFTGGSVCDELCESPELEKALSGFGNVRVLNGAGGGWKQPQQTIVLSMYGDAIDAVVSLDGWNEFKALDTRRIENPSNVFSELNPISGSGYESIGVSWECSRLRTLAEQSHLRTVFFASKLLRERLVESVPADNSPDSIKRLFDLPDDWTPERRTEFNIGQYKKYMRSMHALAGVHGLKEVHCIQAVPGVGKTLTAEEIRTAGDLSYGPKYEKLASDMLTLNADGIPVISLLDCFSGVSETIYADRAHCRKDGPGYRIMALRIAAELSKRWKPGGDQQNRK